MLLEEAERGLDVDLRLANDVRILYIARAARRQLSNAQKRGLEVFRRRGLPVAL